MRRCHRTITASRGLSPSQLVLTLTSVTLVLLASCTQSRTEADPDEAPCKQASMESPSWIREATLPEGFPPPGPVGEVVLKEYPAFRMARFATEGDNTASQEVMFWRLFKHIKRNEIAMTTPVEIGYPDGVATQSEAAEPVSMAFLYRRPTLGKTGADQADSCIVVEDVPAMSVLSIGMRGDYTSRRLADGLDQLDKWISDNPGQVQVIGAPRYLGYNSPMVPGFLRYGEVQLPVRPLQSSGPPAAMRP